MVIDESHYLKEEQKMNELANRDQEMNQKLKTVLEEMEQSHPVQGLSPNGEAPLSFRTMGDLASSWLQERQDVVKKSTFSTYSYCVNMHILPLIGGVLLTELDEEAVISFVRQMQDKELADTTTRSILVVFKFMIKYGIRNGLTSREILDYCHASCHRTESRVLAVQDSAKMKEYLMRRRTIFALAILL